MNKTKNQTMVRVNKRENPYLMVDKTGLNDVRLSWKAKGILCYLLSLPDDWQVYVSELKNHASDGRDSTATAIKELLKFGYCFRKINRNEKGQIRGFIYNVFEVPNEQLLRMSNNDEIQPNTDYPFTANPKRGAPKLDNPELLNNNRTNELKILNNNQSISQDDDIDRDDNSEIRALIYTNIDYDSLRNKYLYESTLEDILEIIVDVMETEKDFIRVNGEEKPSGTVKSEFWKLKSNHIEYVMDCLKNNTTKAKNIRAYMITALYNAPKTMNVYYANLVNHDFANYS